MFFDLISLSQPQARGGGHHHQGATWGSVPASNKVISFQANIIHFAIKLSGKCCNISLALLELFLDRFIPVFSSCAS